MPSRYELSARIHTYVRIVSDMMLKTQRFDQAHWLWMAAGSPRDCQSPAAQDALRGAAQIAGQCGFPELADWIRHEVLPPEE